MLRRFRRDGEELFLVLDLVHYKEERRRTVGRGGYASERAEKGAALDRFGLF
jgi:hypothetical protein